MNKASQLADDFLTATYAEHRYTQPEGDGVPTHEQVFHVAPGYRHGFSATLLSSVPANGDGRIADFRKYTQDKNSILVLRDDLFYQSVCECAYGYEFANLLVSKLGIGEFVDGGGEVYFVSGDRKWIHEDGSIIITFRNKKLISVKMDYDDFGD